MIRYRDLTPGQVAALTNGCGPKGGTLKAPDWLFEASCRHHDFNYALGGDEFDRERADKQFYQAMRRDARRAFLAWRWWYYLMAWLYWRAVRRCGADYFAYRGAWELEPTIDDLLAEAAGRRAAHNGEPRQ